MVNEREILDKRLETELCGVKLPNPIVTASGTYGFGGEFRDFYNPNILGAITLKGTTREPRFGNPTPRIAEGRSGMLNSIGLQNPGIDAVVSEELPKLREFYSGVVIANISGYSPEEYAECCERIDGLVDLIEVNISCPNIHGDGQNFGSSAEAAAEVTKAVRRVVSRSPMFVKLSPNVTSVAEIARACESEGADGLSLINTLLGMRIDIRRREPVLANRIGGFSGPAIFPVALRCVYEAARAVKEIPILGMGGIASAEDVVEMMMAGASAVAVGAENLRDPLVCERIIERLPVLMDKLGIENIVDIIGCCK